MLHHNLKYKITNIISCYQQSVHWHLIHLSFDDLVHIVQGFAGMRVRDDKLHFAPFLPNEWDGYNFRFLFRDRLLEVAVDQNGTQVTLLNGAPLIIDLAGQTIQLEVQ